MEKSYDESFIIKSHRFCSKHRPEVEKSKCVCFYCLETFEGSEVREWIDRRLDKTDNKNETAICPRCGIDSVLPFSSGLPLEDPKFLKEMHGYWFGEQ